MQYPLQPTEIDYAAYLVYRLAKEVRDDIARIAIRNTFGTSNNDQTWYDYKDYLHLADPKTKLLLLQSESDAYRKYGIKVFQIGALKTAIETGRTLWLWHMQNNEDEDKIFDKDRITNSINLLFPKQFIRTKRTCKSLHTIYEKFLYYHKKN